MGALVSLVPATAGHAAGLGCAVAPSWPQPQAALAADVLALTNAHRASLGLRQLVPTASLTAAAEWKAAHMASLGYMEHDDPGSPGRTWYQRLNDCGYTGGAGENIAYGYRTPESVFQGWLDSPGHRANIEDPDYVSIGIGAAVTPKGVPYWAQDFGTRADQPLPAPVPTSQPSPTPTSSASPRTAPSTWCRHPHRNREPWKGPSDSGTGSSLLPRLAIDRFAQ